MMRSINSDGRVLTVADVWSKEIGVRMLTGRSVESDEEAMALALSLAQQAAELGEVPVGAIVVQDGRVIGEGYNQPITSFDPSAHAEMVAIRSATAEIGNYRLSNATLYVTLEPCTMCFGAMTHGRIARLVYGATEPKAGVIVSAIQLPRQPFFNHYFDVQGGVLAQECGQILSDFFARRRAAKKRLKAAAKAAQAQELQAQEVEEQELEAKKGGSDDPQTLRGVEE